MDQEKFESLVKNDYKIFVDTCSLMHKDSEEVFYKIIAPLLCKHNRKLIIPASVLNEIKKHESKKNPDVERATRILNEFAKYELYGTNSKFDENYADNAIAAQFLSLRLKYNLCLITNDNSRRKDGNLSEDILDLRFSRSTEHIKDIRVFFINKKGICEFNSIKKDIKITSASKSNKNTNGLKKNHIHFAFKLPKTPKTNDAILKVKEIPTEGSFIIDNTEKKHKLVKQVGRTGGEGTVYLTDSGLIAKIYKIDKITIFRREKIQNLIDHPIQINNVCLPQKIALNSSKEFVGYLMSKADGNEIKTSIFIPPLFKQKFPTWNRLHLANVALNILKKVGELHKHNIILGDINPSNILLKDESTIYFIDTDSYQIEDYPCEVGMTPYTRFENHGKPYKEYLRTKDDDMFAVSTLIFQLMLPGKLPYSFSGGGSEKDNMRPENFPYNCADGSGYNNAPEGQWVYAWSHLPYKLKESFCKIFKKNEIISIDKLIEQMESYIYQLEQGHQTRDIFPLTYKQINKDGETIKVVHDSIQKLTCKSCGNVFACPNDSYYKDGKQLPSLCDICKAIKKTRKKSLNNNTTFGYDKNSTSNSSINTKVKTSVQQTTNQIKSSNSFSEILKSLLGI